MSASAEDEAAIPYPSDSIYETYFDSSVNIQGSHESLKAVGHGVLEL